MTDHKNHAAEEVGSLAGRLFKPSSSAEIAEAVELAFDYRGDVTLTLKSGELVSGYLFNRQSAPQDSSYLEIFPANSRDVRRIVYLDILTIAFTGEDTANGKSWEAWVSKKESERRAEATRLEAVARTQGYL